MYEGMDAIRIFKNYVEMKRRHVEQKMKIHQTEVGINGKLRWDFLWG
jgi:hypothetical protein